MVPSQSPSRVRTLLSHQLPYCCWLSSEPPLQPSSASFILSSPLHAKRDIRGLGRRWPAILHAVGHNVPIVLSRGRCPGPGERWGDHARPLLSPQAVQQPSVGPRLFFPHNIQCDSGRVNSQMGLLMYIIQKIIQINILP